MIFGERIRLRALEREDIPRFVRWFNDPEVRQYLLMYEPMSTAEEERWFERHLDAPNDQTLGIEARAGEEWIHIGNVGLHRIDWKNRTAALGIAIGDKAYWGQGYGTDAVRTMLRHAFQGMNLHRVELDVYDFNPRAQRCYEKAGFRHEGSRRQAHFHAGCYHDVHTLGILCDEFQP